MAFMEFKPMLCAKMFPHIAGGLSFTFKDHSAEITTCTTVLFRQIKQFLGLGDGCSKFISAQAKARKGFNTSTENSEPVLVPKQYFSLNKCQQNEMKLHITDFISMP